MASSESLLHPGHSHIPLSISNKLLGLFGQELSMPCIGFPYTKRTLEMTDPIVIIVSHSGGTFGPLACSNLMQSFSSSIFAVTSEWDTQVGKQLRSMYHGKLPGEMRLHPLSLSHEKNVQGVKMTS